MHKIIVYVPMSHAHQVREAIGKAGGGKLGTYSFCSFSVRGIGRFKPEEGAHPRIGVVGKLEEVDEERIEVTCESTLIKEIVKAIREAHPYEEVVMDIWPLESY